MEAQRVILEDGRTLTWSRTDRDLFTELSDEKGRLVGVYVADLTRRSG